MPVGTTQPNEKEQSQIKHHLIGFVSPTETLDAKRFSDLAKEAVRNIWNQNKVPILSAGTGFYLRAFLVGMFDAPPIPSSLQSELQSRNYEDLRSELKSLDPIAESKISPNDLYRVRRALAVTKTGVKWSDVEKQITGGFLEEYDIEIEGIFLSWDRKVLIQRIESRAEKILESMSTEAWNVLQTYGRDCAGLNVLGYNFALDYKEGRISLKKFFENLTQSHRQYAKKQTTWFMKEPLVNPLSWDQALQKLKIYI